jgi:hypothetical protein
VVHEPSALETIPVDLPPEMVAALAAFAPLFSDRVWVKAQLLTVGAILATGNRTVCAVLRIHPFQSVVTHANLLVFQEIGPSP